MKITRVVCFFLLTSCAPHIRTTSLQPGKYSEDLSVVRPKIESVPEEKNASQATDRKQTHYIEPANTVNKQLDKVLDSINSINLSQKYIEGFTIQVYSGPKREEALTIKKQLYVSFPEVESEVQFQQPNFRVKAGKYFQQMDAQKDFMAIKRYFPTSILIPDKISIN